MSSLLAALPVTHRMRLRPWRSRLNGLLLLTVVGTAVASYLAWVALDDSEEAFCSGVGDCHTVQSSEFAEVGGVPVAVLGLGMYLSLLGLVLLRHCWRGPAPRVLATWTFAIALSGTLYSGYLTWLELFEIEAICIWCVASALIVTGILLLSLPDLRGAEGDGEGDAAGDAPTDAGRSDAAAV